MRFTEISESTTSGSVSTVAMPLGKTQTRTQVSGLEPVKKVMGGKAKKKGPYSNSINENAELSETDLQEDDIILVPGQGRKMKTGFVPHGQSRVDHEVEMARSDLFSAAKNAKQVYEMIHSVSEDEGLEGWVQEKIIKANDYLNTVREYLEGKQIQQESVVEGINVDSIVTDALKIMRGSELSDAVRALKTVLGDRAYNERRGFYNFYIKQLVDMYGQQSIAEGKIDFAKKIQKNVDKSNKAVVQTKKEVGSRVADIGAGGKEYNVKTDKAWDDAQKAKKAK
jgi:hypothetical protein